MKALVLMAFFPLAVHAQPKDDRFADPCANGSYGVPLQNVTRNDVEVITHVGVGTDDEPSSAGYCVRAVTGHEHVQFLHEFDPLHGYWLVAAPEPGTVLHPDTLSAGCAAGRFRWDAGALQICHQGYGAQSDGKGWRPMEPRTWERSVVRITAPDGIYLAAMTVSCTGPEGRIEVHATSVMAEGTALRIP